MSGAYGFDPDRFIKRRSEPTAVAPLRFVPTDWEHGLRLLADRFLPRGASPERWAQVLADATQIATRYQAAVREAEWDLANLFGYDPEQPLGYVGLAVRLRGRLLVDIDREQAVIKAATGYLYHRPLMPSDAPLLWNFRESRGAQ